MRNQFKKTLSLAVIQNAVCCDKNLNIARAREMVFKAADMGAELVALPEMFNCPYDSRLFADYAESFPEGPTLDMLSAAAREKKIYLFGGSIPEKAGGAIYNTCFVFGPGGELLGKYRKAHLFDVTLSGGVSFKESSTLSRGDHIKVIDTAYGKIGVVICYDIRFPEIVRRLVKEGIVLLIVPGAFNMVTGPAHWELTMRARALDNQIYVAAASPARDESASYIAYGHSMVADPWGKILGKLTEKEDILLTEIDLKKLERIRAELPLLKHLRPELY